MEVIERPTLDVEDAVRRRYATAARAREPELCCRETTGPAGPACSPEGGCC